MDFYQWYKNRFQVKQITGRSLLDRRAHREDIAMRTPVKTRILLEFHQSIKHAVLLSPFQSCSYSTIQRLAAALPPCHASPRSSTFPPFRTKCSLWRSSFVARLLLMVLAKKDPRCLLWIFHFRELHFNQYMRSSIIVYCSNNTTAFKKA